MKQSRSDQRQTAYEALGYRVEIEGGLARVYRFASVAGNGSEWIEVLDSPYHLPTLDFELVNPKSSLTSAVQIYELATGCFDLRDAITRGSA